MAAHPTKPDDGGGVTLPVAVSDGGTGSTTAEDARTALGISSGTLGAVFGDGRSGPVNLDGTNTYAALFSKSGNTYTQLDDVHATTFVVASGVTVVMVQQWIYASVSGSNAGTITAVGFAGVGFNGGSGIAATGTLNMASANGGNGRTSAQNGANGSGGTANGIGGAGGAGGASSGQVGGAGGTKVGPLTNFHARGSAAMRTLNRVFSGTAYATIAGGQGGGSGGASPNTGTATSGSGGGGGNCIRISAKTWNNTGTVTAAGGAASSASVTGDGSAGGGGGGGGGYVCVMTDELGAGAGTTTAAGGAPGAGAGTGGLVGVVGGAGVVEIITPSGTTLS